MITAFRTSKRKLLFFSSVAMMSNQVLGKSLIPGIKYSQVVINTTDTGLKLSSDGRFCFRRYHFEEHKKDVFGAQDRHDSILIQVVQEFGRDASSPDSNLMIRYYKSKYIGFLAVRDTKKGEVPYVDVNAYKLAQIEKISSSGDLSADDKILQVRSVLEGKFEDATVHNSIPKGGYVTRE